MCIDEQRSQWSGELCSSSLSLLCVATSDVVRWVYGEKGFIIIIIIKYKWFVVGLQDCGKETNRTGL